MVESQTRVQGAEHPETLRSVGNLAVLLHRQGKLADAEPLMRKAVAGLRLTLGDAHPTTKQLIRNLAVVLRALGQAAEARALEREAGPA